MQAKGFRETGRMKMKHVEGLKISRLELIGNGKWRIESRKKLLRLKARKDDHTKPL